MITFPEAEIIEKYPVVLGVADDAGGNIHGNMLSISAIQPI